MSEKTRLRPRPDGRTKIEREAGDAAAMLTRQMHLFQQLSEHCFWNWKGLAGGNSYDQGDLFLNAGLRMTDTMAKLGSALARLRAEARQHIKVERVASRSVIAPPSASDGDSNTQVPNDESTSEPQKEGEGVCNET